LVSTSEIAEKYKSTSLALEDLRRSDRAPRDEQANPKEQGQQKDESLKIYMKGYGELRDMMRKHLDSLHV
jgi:hypothetical protein